MKKLNPGKCIAYAFILMALISCNKNETDHLTKQKGKLEITVESAPDDKIVVQSLKSVPIANYHVAIYRQNHQLFAEYPRYAEIPHEIDIEAGNYYIIAHSNNDSVAAFENPFYYGQSEVVTIEGNSTTRVKLICRVSNCAARIVYSEGVTSNFTDYRTVISSYNDSLVYNKVENRTGFFRVGILNIRSELFYTTTEGATASKIITHTIDNVSPGNLYEISIDASLPTGNRAGIDISVIPGMDTTAISLDNNETVNNLQEGDLLITEIMYDPNALADNIGEWFEVYNNTGDYINLQNLVIRRQNSYHTVNRRIILGPGEYFAMARADTAFTGNKYVYTGITLANSVDTLSLMTGTDGLVIATVTYGTAYGFPNLAGRSINLCPSRYNFTDAQLGASWCLSNTAYNTGDFGTPGGANIRCQ